MYIPNIITLRLRQNCHYLADDIFKCIFFLSEYVRISINISLKFVPKGQINNTVLVQMMPGLAPTRQEAII